MSTANSAADASSAHMEEYNMKRAVNLLNRVDKLLVPEMQRNPYSDKLSFFGRKALRGEYLKKIEIYKPTGACLRDIDWDLVEADIHGEYHRHAGEASTLPPKAQAEIDLERSKQQAEVQRLQAKELLRSIQQRNDLPMLPGKWRKEAYAPRVYDAITDYVVTSTIEHSEGADLLALLDTPLNGFLGQSYNYDDHSLTEEWMVTFKDGLSSAPSDDDVIRTQMESLMEIMIGQVQDRVNTQTGVLEVEPVNLGPRLKEVPVWGIDSYTRRMVELAILDHDSMSRDDSESATETGAEVPAAAETGAEVPVEKEPEIRKFIEKILLPAINAQSLEHAHNMIYALDSIVQSPIASKREVEMARAVMMSIDKLGIEQFKIHPKGSGVICTDPGGLKPHVVVCLYLGELYPPYRWCEKLDVVEQAQAKFGLKPTLPDFWNILLERPRQDPKGYGIMWVDASQRANMGSSCSHSCNPNCTSAVVARNGRLAIALTTTRAVEQGEELTMDYYSVTTSETEWRAAICLCGMRSCRGSFLHYAAQDDLQQVLTSNCGILWQYCSLLRACSVHPLSDLDKETLSRHGMQLAALGKNPPTWLQKFVAENLRFVEFERKALPCALLRPKNGKPSLYSYYAADMDARSVMEQRLQSLVCCCSMIARVLENQRAISRDDNGLVSPSDFPLEPLGVTNAVVCVWKVMRSIPDLIRSHLLASLTDGKKIERVEQALVDLTAACSEERTPKGVTSLRTAILSLRDIILKIQDVGSPQARLNLLCDMLVLWANTSNYSSVKDFIPVISLPIGVVSRELGNNIPRSSIHKLQKGDIKEKIEFMVSAASESGEFVVKSELANLSTIPSFPVESKENTLNLEIDGPKAASTLIGDHYLNSNELVYSGSKTYGEKFTFWQLMGWYNAGTGTKESPPDLFGCLQLPLPAHCFGPCSKSYGASEKKALMQHLRDEKAQMHPWPDSLKCCFTNFRSSGDSVAGEDNKSKRPKKSSKSKTKDPVTVCDEQIEKLNPGIVNTALNSGLDLIGSPYLDVMLGQVDAVLRVMQDLSVDTKTNGLREDGGQFDNILPPELPTAWVQCDNSNCRKWRRVAWNVDCDALPDPWQCSMNYWDPENAFCDAPEDSYDPDRESTLAFKINESENCNLEVHAWRDVFCLRNRIYYEGQVKDIREKTDGSGNVIKEAKFHFKGWGSCFDEWIELTSDRIAPHNLHTNPTKSKNPRIQEVLQAQRGFDHNGKSTFTSKKLERGSKLSKKTDPNSEKPSPTSVAEKPSERKRKSTSGDKNEKQIKKRTPKTSVLPINDHLSVVCNPPSSDTDIPMQILDDTSNLHSHLNEDKSEMVMMEEVEATGE